MGPVILVMAIVHLAMVGNVKSLWLLFDDPVDSDYTFILLQCSYHKATKPLPYATIKETSQGYPSEVEGEIYYSNFSSCYSSNFFIDKLIGDADQLIGIKTLVV